MSASAICEPTTAPRTLGSYRSRRNTMSMSPIKIRLRNPKTTTAFDLEIVADHHDILHRDLISAKVIRPDAPALS